MISTDSLAQELDRLYEFEIEKYIERCNELKKSGYRVFRNESGQHKVVGNGKRVEKKQQKSYSYDESTDKKENFLIRAKKRVQRGIRNFKAVVNFIKVLHNNQKNNQRYK